MTDAETTPAPQFLDPGRRVKTVDLDYPVTFAGKAYSQITIRRLTVQEVADFFEGLKEIRAAEPGKAVRWPMYFDADGAPVPEAVLDGLDDDDLSKLDDVVSGFLPRRFQDSRTE